MTRVRLFGWTDTPRIAVTNCVTDAVSRVGGFILESQRFTNNALVLHLQAPVRKAGTLIEQITACKLTLDAESAARSGEFLSNNSMAEDDFHCTLHIRFLHDEPDLRIETPAVPG